jgi:hypothetical protein
MIDLWRAAYFVFAFSVALIASKSRRTLLAAAG